MTTRPIATQIPGHGCDHKSPSSQRSFDSQATWVIGVLGLFWHIINGCLYNQTLADARSTGAAIKCWYVCFLQVSFIGVSLLPGDRTVVYESGRTHPDYQGLGIYKKLKAAIRKRMQEQWPTVSSALSNTPNADTSFIRNSARPDSPSRILQKGVSQP